MRFGSVLSGLNSADRGGVAIGFAIIAPVLATIFATASDIATIGAGVRDMQTGVRAAIQYAMNGGTDLDVAQTQGLNAWQNEPKGGSLIVVLSRTCSGVPHNGSTSCSDGTPPHTYVTATAKATLGGAMLKQSRTVSEIVRVR